MGKWFFELSFNKLYTNIFWNMTAPQKVRQEKGGHLRLVALGKGRAPGTCCWRERVGAWDFCCGVLSMTMHPQQYREVGDQRTWLIGVGVSQWSGRTLKDLIDWSGRAQLWLWQRWSCWGNLLIQHSMSRWCSRLTVQPVCTLDLGTLNFNAVFSTFGEFRELP